MPDTKYHRMNTNCMLEDIASGKAPLGLEDSLRFLFQLTSSRSLFELISCIKSENSLFQEDAIFVFPIVRGEIRESSFLSQTPLEEQLLRELRQSYPSQEKLFNELSRQKNRVTYNSSTDIMYQIHGIKDEDANMMGLIGSLVERGEPLSTINNKLSFIRRMIRASFRQHAHQTYEKMTGFYKPTFFDGQIVPQVFNMREDHYPDQPISAIIADVARLNHVNNVESHEKGDDYLLFMADLIKRMTPRGIHSRGKSADEFYVLLPNCSFEEVDSIRTQIISEVESLDRLTLRRSDGEMELFEAALSIGCATTYPQNSALWTQDMPRRGKGLFIAADRMLGPAKKALYERKGWDQRKLTRRDEDYCEAPK